MTQPDPVTAHPSDEGDAASLSAAFGGKAGILEIGLPGLLFVATYTLGDRDLRLALIVALASAAVLALVRVLRRQTLQHAIGGFIGVGVAAFIASRTGRAEDFYLPGLLYNAGYGAALVISIIVRWPIVGVLLGLVTQVGTAWRRNPVLVRAYTRASWVLVVMFALRLAVQLPLYFAGESALAALGIARVAMGVPLYLATLWFAYRVLKASVPPGTSVLPQPTVQAAETAEPDASDRAS